MKVSQSEKLGKLNVSPSAVAKTIKRYKETGSHEDRPRKGRPRVPSAAEDEFIRVTSLRNRRLTAAQIRDQVLLGGTVCGAGAEAEAPARRRSERCRRQGASTWRPEERQHHCSAIGRRRGAETGRASERSRERTALPRHDARTRFPPALVRFPRPDGAERPGLRRQRAPLSACGRIPSVPPRFHAVRPAAGDTKQVRDRGEARRGGRSRSPFVRVSGGNVERKAAFGAHHLLLLLLARRAGSSAGSAGGEVMVSGSGSVVLPAGVINPSVPIRNIKMKFAVLIGLIQVGEVSNRDIVETVLNLASSFTRRLLDVALGDGGLTAGYSELLESAVPWLLCAWASRWPSRRGGV
ncbi:hypothetical protein SRHO_G00223600 [Serrasalmus rhombeus]